MGKEPKPRELSGLEVYKQQHTHNLSPLQKSAKGIGFKEEIIECNSNVQSLQTQIEDLHNMYTQYQAKYRTMKGQY